MPDRNSPVFTDHTGRRWRRIRLAALVVGGAAALFACVLIVAELFTPPIPPEMSIAAIDARAESPRREAGPGRRAIDPARLAYRRRLAASMRRYRDATPRHDAMVPAATIDPRSPKRSSPIVAGFYVNWADNSLASLTRNVRQARLGRRRMGLHPAERGYAPDPHRAGGARAGQEPAGAVAPVAVHHAEQLRRRGRGFRCGRLRLRIGAPVPRQPGGASQRGAPAPRRGAAARPRRHDARHRELRAGAPRQRAELRPRAAPGDARDRSPLHPGRRGRARTTTTSSARRR